MSHTSAAERSRARRAKSSSKDDRPSDGVLANERVGHRFEKGNTVAKGNSGPNRQRPLTAMLISALNEQVTIKNAKTGRWEVQDKTKARAIIDKMIELAIGGDTTMIKEVLDRSEGKPLQAVRVENPGDALPRELPDGRKLEDLPEEQLSQLWATAAQSSGALAEMKTEGEA